MCLICGIVSVPAARPGYGREPGCRSAAVARRAPPAAALPAGGARTAPRPGPEHGTGR